MQIVTDSAADLSPEQLEGLDIHYAGLRITLDGKTYESGVDLDPITFYQMLTKTDGYPTTSQPSAGDFADIYRKLAQKDPEILSVHISSGLSGTCNAARLGAEMVPEAKVTLWDSKTLSCPLGWQVEEAARMVQAGAKLNDILTRLAELREKVEAMYTLDTLKYLIHGGRINHITGLLASMLNIKPIIGVEKELGKYIQLAKHITTKRAIHGIADLVAGWYGLGSKLRVQLLHGNNMEGVEILREKMSQMFECQWMPTTPIAPVLGAHTGPGMVGLAVSPMSLFEG
jgi:DegV family protein with EDD domain